LDAFLLVFLIFTTTVSSSISSYFGSTFLALIGLVLSLESAASIETAFAGLPLFFFSTSVFSVSCVSVFLTALVAFLALGFFLVTFNSSSFISFSF
jgi:hypothetical protein